MSDKAEWINRTAREFLEKIQATGAATADVVEVDKIPDQFDRRAVIGPAVAALRDLGIIRKTSNFVPSKRPHAHRNPKRRWLLADAEAGRRWLAAHPADGPREIQRDLF